MESSTYILSGLSGTFKEFLEKEGFDVSNLIAGSRKFEGTIERNGSILIGDVNTEGFITIEEPSGKEEGKKDIEKFKSLKARTLVTGYLGHGIPEEFTVKDGEKGFYGFCVERICRRIEIMYPSLVDEGLQSLVKSLIQRSLK